MDPKTLIIMVSIFSACLTITGAAIVAAVCDMKLAKKAMEGIARQPEAKNAILVNMVISIGLVESIPIIAAVLAIVLILANPFLK